MSSVGGSGSDREVRRQCRLRLGVENCTPWIPAEPPWPSWLVDWLGADYFGTVAWVTLMQEATDKEMVHVGNLSQLKALDMINDSMTATGVAQLKGLNRLRQLASTISRANVDGLFAPRCFPELESLSLQGTKIDGAGLKSLANLTNLRRLNLGNTAISDPGLVHLAGLTKLEWLVLFQTAISDAGLVHLKGLERLQALMLNFDSISDAGFNELTALASLRSLDLSEQRSATPGWKGSRQRSRECGSTDDRVER